MAIVTCPNKRGKYCDVTSRYDVINYIMNPAKVKHGICGGVLVNMDAPAEDMAVTARLYGKDSGVRLRHFIISFSDFDDVKFNKLGALAHDLASVIATRYQVVYAVHEDTDRLHMKTRRLVLPEYYSLLKSTGKNCLNSLAVPIAN